MRRFITRFPLLPPVQVQWSRYNPELCRGFSHKAGAAAGILEIIAA